MFAYIHVFDLPTYVQWKTRNVIALHVVVGVIESIKPQARL